MYPLTIRDRIVCLVQLRHKRVYVFGFCHCFVFPFLIISQVQLNVNVETTIVSQIDENKDHCDIEATPTLAAFDQDGNYKIMDRDSSDSNVTEKYPPIV